MRLLILVLSFLSLAAAPAAGQEQRSPPTARQRGGTLDLQFDLHTHPGGAPANPALGITTINVHLTIQAKGVRVDREGKLSLEAAGEYRLDSFAAGAVSVWNDEQRHDTLQGTGSIAEDRTLTLKLEWTHGPGLLIYTVNPGGTFSARQPAVAVQHVMEWKLAPASRRDEPLSDGQRREITTYKARRPSTVVGTQAAAMTESVEIKHQRDVEIVPRG